jgi:hypothetical protein
LPVSVSFLVAHGTKSYQILDRVIAEAAARLDVMDLEIFRSPTILAAPTVPLQHLTPQEVIRSRI